MWRQIWDRSRRTFLRADGLSGVSPSMSAAKAETFGPLVPVIAVENFEEAIEEQTTPNKAFMLACLRRTLTRGNAPRTKSMQGSHQQHCLRIPNRPRDLRRFQGLRNRHDRSTYTYGPIFLRNSSVSSPDSATTGDPMPSHRSFCAASIVTHIMIIMGQDYLTGIHMKGLVRFLSVGIQSLTI